MGRGDAGYLAGSTRVNRFQPKHVNVRVGPSVRKISSNENRLGQIIGNPDFCKLWVENDVLEPWD